MLPPGDGIQQSERSGMKAEPAELAPAVLHVAYDRMPGLGEVDAYLVLAPAFELHLHESVRPPSGEDAPFRAR